MSSRDSAHRYFWIIVVLVAACVFGMIYFLSITQKKEAEKSESLESKLDEQISTTKGIEKNVEKITNENEELSDNIDVKESELIQLYKKTALLEDFIELQSLYIIGGNDERIKVLLEIIDYSGLSAEQQEIYDKISAEITESRDAQPAENESN